MSQSCSVSRYGSYDLARKRIGSITNGQSPGVKSLYVGPVTCSTRRFEGHHRYLDSFYSEWFKVGMSNRGVAYLWFPTRHVQKEILRVVPL